MSMHDLRTWLQHPAWKWERERQWRVWPRRLLVLWCFGLVLPSPVFCILWAAIVAVLAARDVLEEERDGVEEWVWTLPPSRSSRWAAKVLPPLLILLIAGLVSGLWQVFGVASYWWGHWVDAGPFLFSRPSEGALKITWAWSTWMGPWVFASAFCGAQCAGPRGAALGIGLGVFLLFVMTRGLASLPLMWFIMVQVCGGALGCLVFLVLGYRRYFSRAPRGGES